MIEIPLKEAITTEERDTPSSPETLTLPQEQPCIFHSRFNMSSYLSNPSSLTSTFFISECYKPDHFGVSEKV